MSYTIEAAANPGAVYEAIWAPLLAFNQKTIGDAAGVPFALVIRDEGGRDEGGGAVAGGLWAMGLWGSFYIALVVVPEAARGQGLGAALMARAEAEARAQGCRQMWLDTYAFQARGFYEKLGFREFGRLDGPAPMFPRFFMEKTLEG